MLDAGGEELAEVTDIAHLILSLAEKRTIDLIVMGTHGLRGIDRLVMGSVTEKVLRRAPCPVLAVRTPPHYVAGLAHDPEPVHLRKMLLCSDLSQTFFSSCDGVCVLDGRGIWCRTDAAARPREKIPRRADLQSATEEVAKQLERSIAPKTREECIVKVLVRFGTRTRRSLNLPLNRRRIW